MPSDPPFAGVGSWIERRAAIAPSDVALVHDDTAMTYAELAERIRRLANALTSLDVRAGDRVAWIGPNHPAFLESFFATGLLGATLAPVNHRLAPSDARAVLDDVDAAAVLLHDTDPGVVPAAVEHRIAVGANGVGALAFDELVAGAPPDAIDVAVRPDDVVLLPHTSGTTGSPKGVMLTHANVTWNVVNFLSVVDFRPGDVTMAIAPFFRVGGTGVNVLPVLFVGGTVVIGVDDAADGILGDMERHRVTVGFGNPDALDAMVTSSAWSTTDLSRLRFLLTGGAPVPERLIHAFLARGVTLVQGYGLSEAAPLGLVLNARSALERVGSAGRPPMFVDVRVARDDGADAAPNETGELLLRGPNVMAGYWRLPEETRHTIVDGWLRTGDAARIDADGFAWIVGRVRDAFVVGGRTVHPGDVERALTAHPDVAEAGAVLLDDDVVALVVASDRGVDVTQLLAFCRERLRGAELPSHIVFVDALPRNTVGKLDRERLSALAEEHRPVLISSPRAGNA